MDVINQFPPEVSSALSSIFALRMAATVSITLIVHDWVRDLRLEAGIWKDFRQGRWTPTLAAFLIQRYSAQFACWCAFAFLFGGPSINCQFLASGVYSANIVFAASVAYIFAARTRALFENARWVTILLFTLWLALIGCYFYVAVLYRAFKLPLSFQGCNCNLSTTGKITLLGFAASLVFDSVVLILTLARISYLRLKSELGETIRSTSIIYFIAVGSVNLTLVLIIAISDDPTVHATPLGPSFAITNLLLNRMIFGMRERSRTQKASSAGKPGGTQHLEQYKRRRLSRSGPRPDAVSHVTAGDEVLADGTTATANSRSEYTSAAATESALSAGIPMTVTVAQKRSPVNMDMQHQEDEFPHLRKQGAAYYNGSGGYSQSEEEESIKSATSRPAGGVAVAAPALAADHDLERNSPRSLKPYGDYSGPFMP